MKSHAERQKLEREKKQSEMTAAELARKTELNQLRKVLETRPGRAVIRRILEKGKPLNAELITDTNSNYYAQGKRAIACWLYSEIIEAKPEAHRQMMAEAKGAK